MTITSIIDVIDPQPNGVVLVRRSDITLDESGIEVSRAFHRWSLSPGDDLSAQWPEVVTVCQQTWTPEVIAAYQASRPPPPPRIVISRLAFLSRMTPQERITIRTAAKGADAIAEDFIHILDISESVTLTDQLTIDGVNYCESKGYLAPGRAAQILAV
ncbi:MAG: hypothetical protein ACXWHZ_03585 [Usitatibacter sp.]